MPVKPREPVVIKEELEDLDSLINENIRLLDNYPDDFALKIGLDNLKCRQEQLFNELEMSYQSNMIDTYDIVLTGDAVRGTAVSLSYLGGSLRTLQDLITAIVQKENQGDASRGPISNEIKKMAQLNVIATASGSFRVIVSGNTPTLIDAPSKRALMKFNDLIECGNNKEKIKNIKQIVGTRVMSKYKEFLGVLKSHSSNVTLYDKFGREYFDTTTITKENAESIFRVIDEMEKVPDKEETYNGTLKMVDLLKRKITFVLEDGEKQINGHYNEKISDSTVKKYLDQLTTARFVVSTQYNEVTDEEHQEWELIEFVQSDPRDQ